MTLPIYAALAVSDAGTVYTYPIAYSNLQATAAPGVGDDKDDNYAPGSLWVDKTADHVYACVDATAGAAVWVQLDGAGGSYTDEEAQDAVGTILVDSSSIDFTYSDGTPSITAVVKAAGVTSAMLRDSAALSVIGRGGNSSGVPADIAASEGNGAGVLVFDDTSNVVSWLQDSAVGFLCSTGSVYEVQTASDARATLGVSDRWKDPVRVATTANGTLATAFANGQTVDGVTLATGDRILLKNQSTASQNGIRVVAASGAPARASDFDAGSEIPGAAVVVLEGTANADTVWLCTNDTAPTIGTTSITFAQTPASTGTGAAYSVLGVAGESPAVRADITVFDPLYPGVLIYSPAYPAVTWIQTSTPGVLVCGDGSDVGFASLQLDQAGLVSGQLPVAYGGTGNSTGTAAGVTVANEATDTTCFPLFVTAATGDLAAKTNAGLAFNSNTGVLTATGFTGPLTGNASTATALQNARTIGGVSFNGTANIVPQTIESANEATDTTCFPLFITASGTQQLQPKNNTALTYNSNTGALGSTSFVGALTGNASTATALATARAVYGNNFDGTAALTQVIASTYGGTGNGFAKFTGPATTEKTFTLPNATSTILTDNAAVTVAQGGTGRQTGTTAYALVATGTTATGAQQTLASGATTEILVGGGASALPVWTTATGSGAPVRATSPTLVTPALGTPASGVLANCTGTASGLTAGSVTVNTSLAETTTYPMLAGSASGSIGPVTDSNLTYNASTNVLTVPTVVAALTGNASTATALATGRTIYGGGPFDGSANITSIISSVYGGTGNGFAKFTGPATSEKTFTLPDATCTILTSNAAVTPTQGGTGANLSATGGTAQVVKQASTGANFTVGVLSTTEIPQAHQLLTNAQMALWQRQSPGSATSRADDTYGPDRWYLLTQTAAVNVERSTGNVARYAAKLTQSQASAQRMGLAQIVEAEDSIPMRGRTLRLQFNAKCSTTTTLRFAVLEWTGTADSVTSDVVLSWTSSTYTANNFFLAASLTIPSGSVATQSVTTSWTACSTSATISSSCNNLIVFVWTDGTAAQNVTVELEAVTLCDANLSRDWLPRSLADEFARCKRFYLKSYAQDTAPGTATNVGMVTFQANGTGGEQAPYVAYGTEMRATPAKTFYSTNSGTSGNVYNATGAADVAKTTTNAEGPASHAGFTGSFTTSSVYRYQFTADAEL